MVPNEILLNLKPEQAARLIILEPPSPVERHKFWHKREMRIRPSKLNTPRVDDMRTLSLAKNKLSWEQLWKELDEAFPTIGVMYGPLLRNGKFFTYQDRPDNPLLFAQQDADWAKDYDADALEWDLWYFEKTRAMLHKRYIDGQCGIGPYLDALIFLRADHLLLAEQARCKAKFKMASEIKARRRRNKPAKQMEGYWKPIGLDEAVALGYKYMGYQIRKIDRLVGAHYEVLMK